MDASSPPSVSVWLAQLQAGDQAAAQPLWERYYGELVRLARRKLGGTPRRAADEEDVALGALSSFCRAAEAGRFPRLADRDDLWKLLVTITERKAADQRKHMRRQKRGGGKVRGESAFLFADESTAGGLAGAAGHDPTPDEALLLAEALKQRLEQLGDPALIDIAVMKLEGWTNQEIADRLDRTTRSIERKLQRIRMVWESNAA